MSIISEEKERPILVAITAAIAFAGLEILQTIIGVYEIPTFAWAAFVVYAALVFMQTFVFDLHIKRSRSYEGAARNFFHAFRRRFRYMWQWKHWIHFQNYLILPGIVYWSTIALLFLNPFHQPLKQAFIVSSSLALVVVFWYLKTIFYNHKAASSAIRQHVFIVKLYASYVSFAGTLGLFHYFGFQAGLFGLTIFCITFLLVYQALFQHHNTTFDTQKYILFTSTLLALAGVAVFMYWNVNYFTGALAMTAIYNTVWGLIHHKFMDRDLTRGLIYEYFAILLLVLVFVFSVTNFAERI